MVDKLAYSPSETAEVLGVSRPTVYALMKRAGAGMTDFETQVLEAFVLLTPDQRQAALLLLFWWNNLF